MEFAYDFDGGVIDASTFTGNLSVFIGDGNQTVIAGLGDDLVDVQGASPTNHDLINLAAGGADAVEFDAFTDGDTNTPIDNNEFHLVTGFAVADDTINIDVTSLALETTEANPVNPGDALLTFLYTTNTAVDASLGGFNFIKILTPVNTAGLDAQDGFDAAMGAAGAITVNGATDDTLFAYYDATGQQMVLGVDTTGGNPLIAGDDFDVIGLVAMSLGDYNNFNNIAFV